MWQTSSMIMNMVTPRHRTHMSNCQMEWRSTKVTGNITHMPTVSSQQVNKRRHEGPSETASERRPHCTQCRAALPSHHPRTHTLTAHGWHITITPGRPGLNSSYPSHSTHQVCPMPLRGTSDHWRRRGCGYKGGILGDRARGACRAYAAHVE
jgi:hypothetical protein